MVEGRVRKKPINVKLRPLSGVEEGKPYIVNARWVKRGNYVMELRDGSLVSWHSKMDDLTYDLTGILVAWEAVGVKTNYGKQYTNRSGGIGRLFAFFKNRPQLHRLMAYIEPRKRCFHEMIPGHANQKFYIDLDIDDKEAIGRGEEILGEIKDSIKTIYEQRKYKLKDEDILVYTSHGPEKFSAHIVVNNYSVTNSTENFYLCHCVKEIMKGESSKFIDALIYNRLRSLRMYMSHKSDSKRVKVREGAEDTYEEMRKSLVTDTDGCVPMKKFAPSNMNNGRQEREINDIDVNRYMAILNSVHKDLFTYRDTSYGWINLNRELGSDFYCKVCQRVHERESPRMRVDDCGNLILNCRRNRKSEILKESVDIHNNVILNYYASLTNVRTIDDNDIVINLPDSNTLELTVEDETFEGTTKEPQEYEITTPEDDGLLFGGKMFLPPGTTLDELINSSKSSTEEVKRVATKPTIKPRKKIRIIPKYVVCGTYMSSHKPTTQDIF